MKITKNNGLRIEPGGNPELTKNFKKCKCYNQDTVDVYSNNCV